MRALAFSCSLFLLMMMLACSSVTKPDPVSPEIGITASQSAQTFLPGRSLIGYFSVAIDPQTSEVTSVPLRVAQQHLNALKFLEVPGQGSLLKFTNVVVVGRKVDLDVTIQHPFPGMPYYVGYDVKGIVIGPGDMVDPTDPTRVWAGGPEGLRLMNADGWTRWWNPAEFPSNGTVFSYRNGIFGTPSSKGLLTSTLSGYKVFANQLDANASIHHLLTASLTSSKGRGTFLAGTIATRHYELVFPGDEVGGPDLIFNYAIDASHAFPPEYKPGEYIAVPGGFPPKANQLEPIVIDTIIPTNTVYRSTEGCAGGDLDLKIRITDWQALIGSTPVSEQISGIELTSPTLFIGSRSPVLVEDSTEEAPWATWEMQLEGLSPDSHLDQQILVTVYSSEGDYQPNATSYTGSSQLASYYVVRVPVSVVVVPESSAFELNPLSSWPRTGGDIYNRNLSGGLGPSDPQVSWQVNNLWLEAHPVVGPDGRIYATRLLPESGISLDILDKNGYLVSSLEFPWFNPQGNPVMVGCSLMWTDIDGTVMKIFQDGSYETFFVPDVASGPSIFDNLCLNNKGQAIIYGPSGISAFNGQGSFIWDYLSIEHMPTAFIGTPTVAADGTFVVNNLNLSSLPFSGFAFWGMHPLNGEIMWTHSPSLGNGLPTSISTDPTSKQFYYSLPHRLVSITDFGEHRWTWETEKYILDRIAISSDGTVYCAETTPDGTTSIEGVQYKINAFNYDGSNVWTYPHVRPVMAGPVVDSGGYIYFADIEGHVYSLNPDGSLRWSRVIPGEPIYLIPAGNNSLLVGIREVDLESTLICLKDL